MSVEFGNRLKLLIKGKGMYQKDFAKACGLSFGTIRRYIEGRFEPNMWSLRRMREVLGCTYEELIGDDE